MQNVSVGSYILFQCEPVSPKVPSTARDVLGNPPKASNKERRTPKVVTPIGLACAPSIPQAPNSNDGLQIRKDPLQSVRLLALQDSSLSDCLLKLSVSDTVENINYA